MTANMPLIESSQYRGTDVGNISDYQDSKADLLAIYSAVESRLTKPEAVIGLSVDNWRSTSTDPDEDFAAQVIQFFDIIQNVNSLPQSGRQLIDLSTAYLQCQLYASVYELAGRKILRAASLLNRRMTPIDKLGTAISFLKTKGFTRSMAPFDNHLRNGIAHGNFLVDSSSPPNVEYADISSSGTTRATEQVTKIASKTVSIILFLEAALYVNSDRYVDLINYADAQVP